MEITSKTANINGTDIGKYQIVISHEANITVLNSSAKFCRIIKEKLGVDLPIVTDETPVGEYEILIGTSEREKSAKYVKPYGAITSHFQLYRINLDGNTLILNADDAFGVADAVDVALNKCFGIEDVELKNEVHTEGEYSMWGESVNINYKQMERLHDNVEQPIVFKADFSKDEGYFAEDRNTDRWSYVNGEYVTTAGEENNVSYVHVYEANVECTAKLRYSAAGKNGDMALMTRYTGIYAYVKAGYDFKRGEWYIEQREGEDFYKFRLASAKAVLAEDKVYIVSLLVDKNDAVLTVDGEELLRVDNLRHITPGRVAVYAKDITVAVSEFRAVLNSGMGTVLKDIYHINIEDGRGGCSTSFVELTDGSVYAHIPGYQNKYISRDGGQSWEKDTFNRLDGVMGCAHPIRLVNGDLLQIKEGGEYVLACTSRDDGATWEVTGTVCPTVNPVDGRMVANQDGKIMQSPKGRLFYAASTCGKGDVNHLSRWYYSDDNGKTWFDFGITNQDIEGLRGIARFAESKMIECADGSLRVYATWGGMHGCMHYFESTDGGKTWGPNVLLTGMYAPSSTFQIVRDPYGETDYTYYAVWNYAKPWAKPSILNRSRAAIAKTTDGKTWYYLGDAWRWESKYNHHTGPICMNQIVNPSIGISKDALFMCVGLSERIDSNTNPISHGDIQPHIWVMKRDAIPKGKLINSFTDLKIGARYYEAVTFVTERGIIEPTAKNIFNPDAKITAGVFTQALIKLFGCEKSVCTGDTVSVECACAMLCEYAGGSGDGIKWAMENGIYDGQNGEIKPDAPISRALAATMFYNYSNVFGE